MKLTSALRPLQSLFAATVVTGVALTVVVSGHSTSTAAPKERPSMVQAAPKEGRARIALVASTTPLASSARYGTAAQTGLSEARTWHRFGSVRLAR